jgi:membrane fusion protein (multidrug efflux system)
MPSTFSRTLRSLEADGYRRSLCGLIAIFLLFGATTVWFFCARVDVYETTDKARLEVERAAHPLAAAVAGRVAAAHLTLGQKVLANDLLVELDTENQRLQLEEEKARLGTVRGRLEALRNQLQAEDQAGGAEKDAALVAIDEARARQREAEAAAKFADGEAERLKKLDESGLLSKSDLLRAQAEAEKQRQASAAQALTVSRLGSDLKSKERERQVKRAELERDVAELEGDLGTIEATIKRDEYVIEEHRIRAPVSGELGEIADIRPGSFLSEGQRIGAIIPAGELKVVAQFSPLTAVGRIRPGQFSRMRLAGYPWAQYGSVAATVTSVANEPRDGQLRVELSIKPDSVPQVPLQHGLLGTVEVRVDRVSPARLVLRAAGKVLSVARPPVEVPKSGQELQS